MYIIDFAPLQRFSHAGALHREFHKTDGRTNKHVLSHARVPIIQYYNILLPMVIGFNDQYEQ